MRKRGQFKLSPFCVLEDAMLPAGNSMAYEALKNMGERQKGLSFSQRPITLFWRSQKITSMGNFIKNMWMDWQCVMIRALFWGKSLTPSNPFILAQGFLAISIREAITVWRVRLEIMTNYCALMCVSKMVLLRGMPRLHKSSKHFGIYPVAAYSPRI